MPILPVIVGFGGINSAGRSSGFHNYKRLISEVVPASEINKTWMDLAHRMGLLKDSGLGDGQLNEKIIDEIKRGTLIRKIDSFDPEKVQVNLKTIKNASFEMDKANLPKAVPAHWRIEGKNDREVIVTVSGEPGIMIPVEVKLGVSSGANIPHGFDPGNLYNAHHHPLSLQLSIYGASDAINSLGFAWEEIYKHIEPDEISVYAGSAISQVDDNSLAGLIKRPLAGGRVSSKMFPLSLPEMPADFVNSYVINNIGTTGANVGACASFLYNLRQGFIDIQTGKAKVVIVGNADAPLTPEVIEGFKAMGALATDADLQGLDKSTEVNHRRACRPFSSNCGFTIANAAQFVVLMNPELALKTGAMIYGSVADVFVNADANKKSISAPGVGNYISFAKAAALARAILTEQQFKQIFVQAHGTGTPQNRVTESHILNEVAKTFGLNDLMVTAIKSYIGHSFSVAGGDQLVNTLGVWQHGWIPGIKTIDHIADDVYHSHLNILMDHVDTRDRYMQAALINSKGFGGNNGTAVILSPNKTHEILKNKFTAAELTAYQHKNQGVQERINQMDEEICQGKESVIYRFGESVMDQDDVKITADALTLSNFSSAINLNLENPYK